MNGRSVNRSLVYQILFVTGISFVTMALGGAIYLLYRESVPAFFYLIDFAGFKEEIFLIREKSISQPFFLPDWIIYSLPNGLWAFAYALIIFSIWWKSKSQQKYFWLASIPVLVLGFEFLQLVGLREGIFCLQDILSGILGIIMALIIGIKLIKLK